MLNWLFPKKSKWIDIGMYDKSGYYKLIQMRFRIDNNKKEFRTVNLGFINNWQIKDQLATNIMTINSNG